MIVYYNSLVPVLSRKTAVPRMALQSEKWPVLIADHTNGRRIHGEECSGLASYDTKRFAPDNGKYMTLTIELLNIL